MRTGFAHTGGEFVAKKGKRSAKFTSASLFSRDKWKRDPVKSIEGFPLKRFFINIAENVANGYKSTLVDHSYLA